MDSPTTGLALVLAIASEEARALADTEVAPRHLFAGLFDVCGGRRCQDLAPVLPLDHFAKGVLREAAGGAGALLSALASSPTMVGPAVGGTTPPLAASAEAWSDDDLRSARLRLAPAGPRVIDYSPDLVPIEGGRLVARAAQSFTSVRTVLADRAIRLTVISAHRTGAEQREDFEAISEFTKGSRSFPVGSPGTSLHERGLAIDVAYEGYLQDFRTATVSTTLETIRNVFRDHGWYQFDPTNDPYHFAYGRVG